MPRKQKKESTSTPKVYVVSVDMGYGHQRAAYPLQHLAMDSTIIHANNYEGIPKQDQDIWLSSRKFYEFMSRFKKLPIVGEPAWRLFDQFQKIQDFYPRRDLSRPTMQLWSTMNMIKKRQWGKHLIDMLEKDPKPLVTSFFIPAYMADHFNYSEDIYLIVCDADVSRAWAAYDPKKSRIKYLAPSKRVVERLKQYGVPKENIYYTGFPLPLENIGHKDSEILKNDLAHRLRRLDPECKYCIKYKDMLEKELEVDLHTIPTGGRITLTFAVGGAGAQREIGMVIVKALRGKLLLNQVKINLIAGTHKHIAQYFHTELERFGLHKELGNSIEIVYAEDKYTYFKKFNEVIRHTDILWTKPSELSFYVGLGLPIIMAPPIGSQEFFNRRWLLTIGAAINQETPRYTDEWLFDWLKSGWFAEAAMHGYFEAAKYGTLNIEKIITHEESEAEEPQVVLQY
ncbi:MAG: hypothetical protein ACPGO5_03475 [Patescibacteria group bacterium]